MENCHRRSHKKCFVWCLSVLIVDDSVSYAMREIWRDGEGCLRENTFVIFSKWMKILSIFLALMIVFFPSTLDPPTIHSTYTCRHSEKRNYFSHSLFFMWFFFLFLLRFSESVSEFFYVFLFTALLLKSWKMKMNARIFFRSGFFSNLFALVYFFSAWFFFLWNAEKTELLCVYPNVARAAAWRVQLLYVGAWVSKRQ